jgi:hypothetical protein
MLLIDLFWLCLCFPGYALARRCWPGLHDAGLLAVIASSVLGTFLLLSPVSMLCYAVGAPVAVFSAAVALSVVVGVAYCVRVRADRALIAGLRRENLVAWILLAGLLWLQVRVGAYFGGDATFHLGRVRVLLDHGFTNRDIYLKDYYFQHIYHTNLLFPLYASASQLSGQSYLATWFHSQAFAKLLVAAGHYVLGFAVTRRKLPAWLLALTVITANAGETYTTYPNTVAVGWLLPLQLAAAYTLLARDAKLRYAAVVAACSFVTAQVHALYAVYAGLAMAPALVVLGALPWSRGRRRAIALGLVGALGAVPFLLVSQFAFKPKSSREPEVQPQPAVVAPAPQPIAATTPQTQPGPSEPKPAGSVPALQGQTPPAAAAELPEPPRWLPEVDKGKPSIPTPAVALGGGHLEKSLELDQRAVQVWFAPEKMGGKGFVALGFLGFAIGLGIAFGRAYGSRRAGSPSESRQSSDRAVGWQPAAAAAVGGLGLSLTLFWPPATTFAVALLDQPFTVARLSTALSSLLLLGIALGVGSAAQLAIDALPPRRWLSAGCQALVLLLAVGAATRLTGHAPMFFGDVVQAALRPREVREAGLDVLEQRRQMLKQVVPPGTTVLTTARFARSVVMLCDCYVIIADRGHTYVSFARERREQLLKMNGPATPWPERAELIKRYGLKLVIFESRHLARLYRWSHEHGTVIGEAAGLEVVELRDL